MNYHAPALYFLITCVLIGCGTSKLGNYEFIKYLNDDSKGISKTIDKENIIIKVTYYPYQIFVYREIQGLSIAERQKALKENVYDSIYHKNTYFLITIKSKAQGNEGNYGFRQLTKKIQPICNGGGSELNIYLQDEDKVKHNMNYMNCEMSQALAGEIQMLIAFEKPKKEGGLKLHLEGLYDAVGDDFEYSSKDLKNIPVLDFNL